jgi:hypothetical protein
MAKWERELLEKEPKCVGDIFLADAQTLITLCGWRREPKAFWKKIVTKR